MQTRNSNLAFNGQNILDGNTNTLNSYINNQTSPFPKLSFNDIIKNNNNGGYLTPRNLGGGQDINGSINLTGNLKDNSIFGKTGNPSGPNTNFYTPQSAQINKLENQMKILEMQHIEERQNLLNMIDSNNIVQLNQKLFNNNGSMGYPNNPFNMPYYNPYSGGASMYPPMTPFGGQMPINFVMLPPNGQPYYQNTNQASLNNNCM